MMRKHRSYVSMLPLSQRPVPSVSSSVAHVCRDICRHARPSPCSSHFRVSLGGPAPGPSPGLQQPVVWGARGHCSVSGRHPRPAWPEPGLEPGSAMRPTCSECEEPRLELGRLHDLGALHRVRPQDLPPFKITKNLKTVKAD